jgi:RNA polymerase sigma-70 factor (ECF subfamily)
MSDPSESLDVEAITLLLRNAREGDAAAEEKALREVYGRLRRMAGHYLSNERGNHTLQPTALVNEAYLKMFDSEKAAVDWVNRDQFFKLAGRAMRQILVDHARRKNADIRGAGEIAVPVDDLKGNEPGSPPVAVDILDLDRALSELSQLDPKVAQVVELKYFAGMTDEQVAQALDLKFAKVREFWLFAKGWLATRLGRPGGE